jgi:hypothetical protein
LTGSSGTFDNFWLFELLPGVLCLWADVSEHLLVILSGLACKHNTLGENPKKPELIIRTMAKALNID